jgi:hypothetical protein
MNLYEPSTYRDSSGGTALPLLLKGRRTALIATNFIFSNARRASAKLELDTGADIAFVLDYEFARKHHLLPGSTAAGSGRGAGGEQKRAMIMGKRAGLGPFAFDSPPILVPLQNEGSDGDRVNGIVGGGEILRRFRVVIDYSRSRILAPNKHFTDSFDVEG